MSWIPSFEPGVWNAWLFMIIYPLQWGLMYLLPKSISERTSHAPEIIRSRKDTVAVFLTQGLWIIATLYSIFVPFKTGTAWLWVGLVFFVLGLAALVSATVYVARTPPDKPFTTGIYRYSRHPMYLSMILVYLGVSIAAASWLFFVITIFTFILQHLQMLREEDHCCKQFGDLYRAYMARTSRWIGLPQKG